MSLKQKIEQGQKVVGKVSEGINKIYDTKNKYVQKINQIEGFLKQQKIL